MKKKLLAVPITLLGAFGIAFAFAKPSQTAIKTKAEWSEFVDGVHQYGQSYEVPTMTYTKDGVNYTATCIVTYPDKTQSASTNIELTQSGKYIFEYSVLIDGEIHNITESIIVNYNIMYVGDPSKSSVRYVSETTAKDYAYNATTPGQYVQLAQGDTLYFTEPVYIEDMNSINHIVRGYVASLTKGTVEFNQLFLTLTDADNPDIYVTLCYYSHVANNGSSSSHSSSAIAKSEAQQFFAGIHQTQGLHTNDTYGLWSGVTFDAYNDEKAGYKNAADAALFTFGLNYETKEVYGTGFQKGNALEKVLDLDNPEHVSIAWPGFQSNRAFLSIHAESYASSTANFVITDFNGSTSEEIAQNLYFDKDGPEITVISDYDELPDGTVGCYYPVPGATAYDQVSLECEVKTEVYYDYLSPNRTNVQITNGRFYLDKAGIYTILYTSYDKAGNESKLAKSMCVFVDSNKPDFTLPDVRTNYAVGEYVNVDRNITVTGGVGNSTLEIYYEVNGEKTLVESEGFRITNLVDYKVIYEVTDYIGQKTAKEYTITVTNSNQPILSSHINFPRYFISRGYYDFPEEVVYLYEDGKLNEKPLTLEVIDSNGSKTYTSGQYNPVVDLNNSTVTVKAKYGNVVLQQEEIVTIKNLGVGDRPSALNLSNYFVENKMSKELIREGMSFVSLSAEDAKVDYANPLLSMDFSLDISKLLGFENNSKFVVTLIDFSDSSLAVSMDIETIDEDTYFVVNGKESVIPNDYLNSDSNSYTIKFDGENFECENIVLPVIKTTDGRTFNGFKSTKVYLTIELLNPTNNTSFVLNGICGYNFSSSIARDRIAPIVNIDSSVGGTRIIGDIYTINPVYSIDVLSPNVVLTFDVQNPDGTYITALDGTVLHDADPTKSYDILLSQYGQYYFTISSIEDSRFLATGNLQNISYYVNVYDDVAPTITFTTGMVSEAKVGDVILIPKFEVSDNITSKENIIIQRVLLSPTGVYTYFDDDIDAFKVKNEGVYRLTIRVVDEAGNIASKTFTVSVSE